MGGGGGRVSSRTSLESPPIDYRPPRDQASAAKRETLFKTLCSEAHSKAGPTRTRSEQSGAVSCTSSHHAAWSSSAEPRRSPARRLDAVVEWCALSRGFRFWRAGRKGEGQGTTCASDCGVMGVGPCGGDHSRLGFGVKRVNRAPMSVTGVCDGCAFGKVGQGRQRERVTCSVSMWKFCCRDAGLRCAVVAFLAC
jgi:hypothetical protein